MAEEKKGFWSSLFAPKKSSCCCGVEFEPIPEDDKAIEIKLNDENNNDKQKDNKPPTNTNCCG